MLFVYLPIASNIMGVYFRMLHCASNAWHWYLCHGLELWDSVSLISKQLSFSPVVVIFTYEWCKPLKNMNTGVFIVRNQMQPRVPSSSTHPALLSSSACCHLKHFYSSINPAISVLSWYSWCDFLLVPLQDHPAARWQDLFCWHWNSHWVEWIHGGGCPGWRKSSQRGTGDAQGTL